MMTPAKAATMIPIMTGVESPPLLELELVAAGDAAVAEVEVGGEDVVTVTPPATSGTETVGGAVAELPEATRRVFTSASPDAAVVAPERPLAEGAAA